MAFDVFQVHKEVESSDGNYKWMTFLGTVETAQEACLLAINKYDLGAGETIYLKETNQANKESAES